MYWSYSLIDTFYKTLINSQMNHAHLEPLHIILVIPEAEMNCSMKKTTRTMTINVMSWCFTDFQLQLPLGSQRRHALLMNIVCLLSFTAGAMNATISYVLCVHLIHVPLQNRMSRALCVCLILLTIMLSSASNLVCCHMSPHLYMLVQSF